MKKFAKLALLFAAVGLAACTNDVTEDLATTPDFAGGGSVKTLSVALDGATRVALGEKSAEGMYPVEWQESDVLRINEGKTSAIAIGEDKSVANFTFAVADTTEYHVVYPYVEGLTAVNAACQPVEFATVQNYTEGSFDTASFPMYGHVAAEEGAPTLSSASLDYLAGVLCLKAKGAGEVLTSITLSVTEGAIAGTFDVDCTSGDLTAHEDASKTLTYMLPEGGITLSETPAVFYIAVPAGDYKTMVAKLNTADVAMSLGVPCTGTKAIKAGAVREFAPVTFVANDTADHAGAIFEISDEASLLKFALLVADNNFTYDSAAVTASFEVSGTAAKAWGPIEGYAKLLEGNGNTITGLSAPLFGTTSATIQNLNLKTNVTLTEDLVWGAFARELVAKEGKQGELINCDIVEGSTIELLYEKEVVVVRDEEDLAPRLYFVGGMVGKLLGGAISECDNNADITISKMGEANDNYYLSLGGVAGRIAANDSLCADGEAATNATVSNAKNYGAITMNGPQFQKLCVLLGGCVGSLSDATISSFENHGEMSFSNTSLFYLYSGGVVGWGEGATVFGDAQITKCKNYADINFYDTVTDVCRMAAAGIAGYTSGPTYTVKESTNVGNIFSAAKLLETGSGNMHQVSGIVARCGSNIINCVNGVEGDATKGAITVSHTTPKIYDAVSSAVAGIAAYWHNESTMSGCVNYAPITAENVINTSAYSYMCAGLVGYGGYNATSNGLMENCTNKGAVTVNCNGSDTTGAYVGGCVGHLRQQAKNIRNEAPVLLNLKGNVKVLYVGGTMAYKSDADLPLEDIYNTAAVEMKMNGFSSTETYFGGAIGKTLTTLNKAENSGTVTVNDLLIKTHHCRIGGAVGHMNAAQNTQSTNVKNSGKITVKGKIDNSGTSYFGLFIGGVAGQSSNGLICDIATSGEHYTNKGDICVDVDVDHKTTGMHIVYIGGIIGSMTGGILQGAYNRGNMDLDGDGFIQMYIGGVLARKYNTTLKTQGNSLIDKCQNHGEMDVNMSSRDNTGYAHVGGILGHVEDGSKSKTKPTTTVTDVCNYAPLTLNNTICETSFGGIIGTNYTELKNLTLPETANMTASGTFESLRMGGFTGLTTGTATTGCVLPNNTNLVNEGATLTVLKGAKFTGSYKNTANQNGSLFVGGITGMYNSQRTPRAYVDCTNRGAIVINDVDCAKSLFAGGIVGSLSAAIGNSDGYPSSKFVENDAPISVSGKCDQIYVGGVCGSQQNGEADGIRMVNNTAKGIITVDAAATQYNVGGVFGLVLGMIARCNNDGAVYAAGSATNYGYVGGVVGRKKSSRLGAGCINTAAVEVSVNASPLLAIGGLVGLSDNIQFDYAESENSGEISFKKGATCDGEIAMGGIIGYSNLNPNTIMFERFIGESFAVNKGNILMQGSTNSHAYIGGVVGLTFSKGTATIGGVTKSASAGVYTAAVTRDDANTYVSHVPADESFSNTAMVRFAGSAAGNLYIGGAVGAQDGATLGNTSSTTPPAYNGTYNELFFGDICGHSGDADFTPQFAITE